MGVDWLAWVGALRVVRGSTHKVNAPHTSTRIQHQCTYIAHTHPKSLHMLHLRYTDLLRSRAYLWWAWEWRNGASKAPTNKVNAHHTPTFINYPCAHIAHTHPIPLHMTLLEIKLRYNQICWDLWPIWGEPGGVETGPPKHLPTRWMDLTHPQALDIPAHTQPTPIPYPNACYIWDTVEIFPDMLRSRPHLGPIWGGL